VEKWYGNNHVVKDMNLEIQEGEFLTLLGPSGCGKTTTLRMIAGFEDASSGSILVQGERVEDKEPFQRDVNTVFQNYSLFMLLMLILAKLQKILLKLKLTLLIQEILVLLLMDTICLQLFNKL
jgi:ABC-type nitrate/sulfonate/bicarbonate transport system ATPase subunit